MGENPRRQFRQGLGHHIGQVGRLPVVLAQARFQTRQRQQLIDHPGQAVDRGGEEGQRLVAFGFTAGRQRILCMQAQDRQRRAHFMGRVGDEAVLTAQHLIDLPEQAVDRCLHRLQLFGQRYQL
ncbi:hypothetical protein D3C71_1778520 [compost metagenome]